MKENKPTLLVSYSNPDRASGTPVVIRNLLENFESDEVVLIGRPTLKKERINNLYFKYPIITIPTPPVEFRGERLWRLLSVFIGVWIGLLAFNKYKLKAVLSFYRDESSLLTGFILHKLTKLPHYAYFCDLYLENYISGYQFLLAKWLQPRIFSRSKKIFVLTEAMKDYFECTYGINPIVVPHCNNLTVKRRDYLNEKQIRTPLNIGYLGTINNDRIPSLKLLCEAIKGNNQFHMRYFSATPPSIIKQHGLFISNSDHKFIKSNNELINEMSSCDVLYLPTTISDVKKEREFQVKTGFPTKAIEYLICQKPILVHCKKHYYVAKFFRKFDCGYVTDGDSEEILIALNNIKDDFELRKRIASNSYKALSYFDGKDIANILKSYLK
jgi:glycosyltransferase involved in cell wall biosynthesis